MSDDDYDEVEQELNELRRGLNHTDRLIRKLNLFMVEHVNELIVAGELSDRIQLEYHESPDNFRDQQVVQKRWVSVMDTEKRLLVKKGEGELPWDYDHYLIKH